MFIIIPVTGAPLLYLFAPETKGLSLEEVGACFGDPVALDLTHMDADTRENFDREIMAAQGKKELELNPMQKQSSGLSTQIEVV